MKQKRVLMKDIAAAAGVHQTTVSLALRNHPSLPKKTRERIQSLADQMGYRPDPALSALIAYRESTKKTPADQVIAFVINCRDEEHFNESHVHRELLDGARERASKLGFKVDLFWYGRDYKNGRSLDRVLKSRGIRGIILAAFDTHITDIQMDWEFYSVVKINILPVELAFDTILSNQMFAVRQAMSELRKMDIHRIGLAVAEHDEAHNRNMYTAGYYVGQRRSGSGDFVPPFTFKRQPPESLIPQVVEWGREHRLQAILSNWNNFDESAVYLSKHYNQECRYVPLDADNRTRQYGGIYQNHPLIGRRSVDMVVGQIKTFRQGQEESVSLTMLNPTWLPLTPWTNRVFEEDAPEASESQSSAIAG